MKKEIDRVTTASGKTVMLTDYPCDHCGKANSPYLAIHESGIHAFCSWECRQDAMRIDGEPATEATAKAAGLHFIGPRPEA